MVAILCWELTLFAVVVSLVIGGAVADDGEEGEQFVVSQRCDVLVVDISGLRSSGGAAAAAAAAAEVVGEGRGGLYATQQPHHSNYGARL